MKFKLSHESRISDHLSLNCSKDARRKEQITKFSLYAFRFQLFVSFKSRYIIHHFINLVIYDLIYNYTCSLLGYETFSLILMKECRLRMFVNRVLRKIFECERAA
jgi:hypothetical protein